MEEQCREQLAQLETCEVPTARMKWLNEWSPLGQSCMDTS